MYLVFDKYALLILNWEKYSNLIINNILKFSNEIKQFDLLDQSDIVFSISSFFKKKSRRCVDLEQPIYHDFISLFFIQNCIIYIKL
jgi:hypothetical protein